MLLKLTFVLFLLSVVIGYQPSIQEDRIPNEEFNQLRALYYLYSSTSGPKWHKKAGWIDTFEELSSINNQEEVEQYLPQISTNPCKWHGITCQQSAEQQSKSFRITKM
jgi:hypothetical protein